VAATLSPMPIETVRGSHYEMGLQHGRAWRHVIHASVHAWALRHDFQGTDEAADKALEPVREGDRTFAPWVFDELRGIAEGSGVPPAWIERMHMRVWNRVPRTGLPAREGGCTGIGMLAEGGAVLVGGTLDDPRQCYVLIRRVPARGIPHVMVQWAGAGWGHNGVNAAGLCIAESSLGGTTPELRCDDPRPRVRGSMTGRILLETCEDAPQAIEALRRLRPTESIVLGDAKGSFASCQCFGWLGQACETASRERDFLFNTNHIHAPELVESLAARGCMPKLTEYSITRFAVLERARAAMPRTAETMQALLRSHDGYPHSVCNDGTVTATYAQPQARPAALFVADCPPCRSEFVRYAVEAG